jgi:hypothetical protein
MIKISVTLLLSALFFTLSAQTDLVTYAGNSGKETFFDVMQLSDGTFVVTGYSENLDWIAPEIPRVELSYPGTISNGQGTNRYGIILHFNSQLSSLLRVVHFPQGAVEDIRFIKTNSLPYAATGDLFISCNTSDTDNNDGGYVLAKLNGNFVNEVPTSCVWARDVWAKNYAKESHPWDVTSDGEIYYVSGESHAYDWSAMYCLNENGERRVVENWRTHWQAQGGEWKGTPASSYTGTSTLNYSGIVMKSWGRCEMRSWTQEEFDAMIPDGNGGTKKGTWPSDFFYTGPCDINNVTAESPGYNGYSPESCCPVWGASSIVVDRRDNHVYLGMNFKSYYNFPEGGGTPDFEPAVLAFDDEGALKWWSRLYHEINPEGEIQPSIPDQYVDALAIDYSSNKLVVGARSHGNNMENLWEGNEIFHNPSAQGFQNRFTGTQGDIHISWLGKLTLAEGNLMNSTYMAEYSEGATNFGGAHPDPNLDGWANPNGGWPNVNTTRMAKNGLEVASDGRVGVVALGRRTITTANAYQKMVKPQYGGSSCWNSFVRLYEEDFSVPLYSSLVVGDWDTLTQAGGGNTELYGLYKTADGMVAVGRHYATSGVADGESIPTTNVPSWGTSAPSDESAILVFYKSDNMINPNDGAGALTVEESTRAKVKMYPNPTEGMLRFDEFLSNIVVMDVFGKLIQDFGPLAKGEIDLSMLSQGTYIIKANSKRGKVINRVIIR